MFKTCEINDGVNLHYLEDDRFKTITTAIFIRSKLTKESATKTALVAENLRGGCKKYPSMRTMAVKLEEMWGSAYEVSVLKRGDEQIIYIYLEGLTKTFGEGLEFLKDMLFQNCMDNERFLSKSKKRLSQSIDAIKDNKGEHSIEKMTEALCKDCDESFGVPVLGYAQVVDLISKEEIFDKCNTLLSSAPIDIFVVGSEAEETVKKECKNLFKETRNIKDNIKSKAFVSNREQCLTIEEDEENNQGRLCMAFSFGEENISNKLIPVLVLNEILGGSSNSRLFSTVREKEGLCYSINSFVFKQKMLLVVQAGIDKGAFKKVGQMVEEAVESIKNQVSEEELKDAKTSLIKTYETLEDVPADLINFALTMHLNGLKMDLKEFEKAVNQVSAEEIKETAKNIKCEIKYFLK